MKGFSSITLFLFAALVCVALVGAAEVGVNQYSLVRDELSPEDIVILANASAPQSVDLARYYAEKRGIPVENIVLLPMPEKETVSWAEYVAGIEEPLRSWLKERDWIREAAASKDVSGVTHGIVTRNRIGYVVICQGVPLRIAEDARFHNEGAESDLRFILHQRVGSEISKILLHSYASVDSELAAMTADFNPILGGIPNLLYKKTDVPTRLRGGIVRTSRLGGADYAAARALINSALSGEARGLQGRVYIDRGGPYPMGEKWLSFAASAFAEAGWDVQVDEGKETFQPGVRFDAPAVYFGWYNKSVDGPFLEPGMSFPPGAVAAHLYSFSAASLADRSNWCAAFVERGVAGTFGNVYEPGLEFTHDMGVVTEAILGGWTFCDAAWSAMPVLSWQGVILGDPLYRPMPWMASGAMAKRPSGVYPALSGLMRMREEGRGDEALAAAKRALEDTHDFALALFYARMLHEAGRDAEARDALLFIARATDLNCDSRSVALESARFLGEIRAYDAAFSILETLRGAETSEAFRLAVTRLGAKLAEASGRAGFIGRWPKDEQPAK